MSQGFTTVELEAYLDEALSTPRMAEMEAALRARPELARELAAILARRDGGMHSLASIWRAERLSCPTRQELGSYLLQALDDGQMDYIQFHLEQIGCRVCQANLDDLQSRRKEATASVAAVTRRTRYFQSSAGLLKK